MTPGVLPGSRPPHIDGSAWSEVRKRWISAAGDPHPSRVRTQLAADLGLTLKSLRRWAKRCGWPLQRRNGGK